jgi:hypothetical protein
MLQSVGALLAVLALVILASAAGCALASRMSWTEEAVPAGLPLAAGLAAAPLLAGLAAVGALWAWPGGPPGGHLLVVLVSLSVVALAAFRSPGAWWRSVSRGVGWRDAPAAWMLAGFGVLLVVDCLTVPLIQNDALEYATVARILFDTRQIGAYPVIDAGQHRSGFYGPWTHPPLYVALLYLGDAIQRQAEDATVLRLFAPWCLAGAVACVIALAHWARRGAGALAGVLLASTPLLFLGAASALIDALPVLGFSLSVLAVAGAGAGLWPRAMLVGGALGLALWTHSQAILFPLLVLPLLCLREAGGPLARMRAAAPIALASVALALLVGALPYLRNQVLFGSPVSDNPIVFALPSLDWQEYFRVQRGLSSAGEIVQYGLLKPWFAVEAYSLVFWLALPPMLGLWRRMPSALAGGAPRADPPGQPPVVAMCAAIVALYLAGAVLSVALGVDLMVRNERYMLVLVPGAAVLAAGWLAGSRWRHAVLAVLALQLLVLGAYRASQLGQASAKTQTALERWPPFGAAAYVASNLPADARVLSLKPADMFYAGRTMTSYLDPALLPFYDEHDARAAAQRLRQLGVGWVQMPDYWLPPVYNSALMQILADPALTDLRFDREGYQVFALREETGSAQVAACGSRHELHGWSRERQFVLGGRKNLLRLPLGTEPLRGNEESRSWNRSPVFQRETLMALSSRIGLAPPTQTSEWLIDVQVEGEGYLQVLASWLDADGRVIERRLVADRPLAAGDGVVRLARRVLARPGTRQLELRLEHRAASRLRPLAASVEPLCRQAAS